MKVLLPVKAVRFPAIGVMEDLLVTHHLKSQEIGVHQRLNGRNTRTTLSTPAPKSSLDTSTTSSTGQATETDGRRADFTPKYPISD